MSDSDTESDISDDLNIDWKSVISSNKNIRPLTSIITNTPARTTTNISTITPTRTTTRTTTNTTTSTTTNTPARTTNTPARTTYYSEDSDKELSISEVSDVCSDVSKCSCHTEKHYIFDEVYGIFDINEYIKEILFSDQLFRLKSVQYAGCSRFNNKTFNVYDHIIGSLYLCNKICKKLENTDEQTILCIQTATVLRYIYYFPFEDTIMYVLGDSYIVRCINNIDAILQQYKIYNILSTSDINIIKEIINDEYKYTNINIFNLDCIIRWSDEKINSIIGMIEGSELINDKLINDKLIINNSFYTYLTQLYNVLDYKYNNSSMIIEIKSKMLDIFKELDTIHNFKKFEISKMTDYKMFDILLNTNYNNLKLFKDLYNSLK